MRSIDQRKALRSLFATVLVATGMLLSSCAIRLVSDYDETTDRAVTALQKKTEAHLVNLEGIEGRPNCKYESNQQFYNEAKVDVSAIAVRAAAIPKNEITSEQIRLLSENLEILEQLHQIACLSKEQIIPLRAQFNSSYTAILKLELAKRRAE